MAPPQPPQGSLRDPTQGETPLRKSEMCTDDGNRQERHGARGATMRRELTRRLTQRNGVGHARDIARERQQSPRRSVQGYHQEGAREGMSERLRQGLPQRNKREKKLQTPEGEGPSREGRTLADSQPQGGNSKRNGSPRVPGEPTGRGGSHNRRRRLQA